MALLQERILGVSVFQHTRIFDKGQLRDPAYTFPMSNTFMARAIQLSIENVRTGRGGPFGAVVAKDGKFVAEGVNSVTATNDPTAHAEINAIREACKKLGA